LIGSPHRSARAGTPQHVRGVLRHADIRIRKIYYYFRDRVWIKTRASGSLTVASANGDGRNFYYRQFTDPNTTFKTEEQALSYGFIVARAWIDEALGDNEGIRKALSDTLISGIVTLQGFVNHSQKIMIELSDTIVHSQRLIVESSSSIAKLKVKRLFEDAP
jgi:hypothetical protein